MPELRHYQKDISKQAFEILRKYKLVYLMLSPRVGKTLTALETAKLYGARKVLFLTKKKAIESILQDYNTFGYNFNLEVLNYESIHTLENNIYDLVICDEAHTFSVFPKPGKRAKDLKRMFGTLPMILLSGTPTPESFSQIFHQLWISYNSPFKNYVTFYKWAFDFVNIKKKRIGAFEVNDYSEANWNKIEPKVKHLFINFSQKDAGFESEINEHFLYVKMQESTYKLISKLKKDKVIEGKNEVILADTPVSLMQKIHQLSSGTIKFESGGTMVLDYSKAEFIKEYFCNKKIAIVYKFKAEKEMLVNYFKDLITEDIQEFNNTNKWIIGQYLSIREGVNLSKADCLVFLNIDFSATSYFQARDRMTTKERLKNDVYYLFSDKGIESKIYDAVSNKIDYTLQHFKKDLLTLC